MSKIQTLKILASADKPLLTPAQKRFNTLLGQIERSRKTLAAWQHNIPLYQQAQVKVLQPLRTDYLACRRLWMVALAGLLAQPGWSRAERGSLQAMVCDVAGELLAVDSDDLAAKALYDEHNEVDFETERQQAMAEMKGMAEAMSGLDLGDLDTVANEDELFKRLQDSFAAQAAAQDQAEPADTPAGSQDRRQTAAQQRRAAEAQQATQSVREVYRKLASALHPDREPDAVLRLEKTALMQRVNQAYAANDLLALLELQLQIEQVDAGHIAQASADRVRHYNKVLTEQLAELKSEIEHIEMGFCIDFGIPAGTAVNAVKLLDLIDQGAREVKALTVDAQRELRLLTDRPAIKRLLKRWRQEQAQHAFEGDFFF